MFLRGLLPAALTSARAAGWRSRPICRPKGPETGSASSCPRSGPWWCTTIAWRCAALDAARGPWRLCRSAARHSARTCTRWPPTSRSTRFSPISPLRKPSSAETVRLHADDDGSGLITGDDDQNGDQASIRHGNSSNRCQNLAKVCNCAGRLRRLATAPWSRPHFDRTGGAPVRA